MEVLEVSFTWKKEAFNGLNINPIPKTCRMNCNTLGGDGGGSYFSVDTFISSV